MCAWFGVRTYEMSGAVPWFVCLDWATYINIATRAARLFGYFYCIFYINIKTTGICLLHNISACVRCALVRCALAGVCGHSVTWLLVSCDYIMLYVCWLVSLGSCVNLVVRIIKSCVCITIWHILTTPLERYYATVPVCWWYKKWWVIEERRRASQMLAIIFWFWMMHMAS